MFQQPPIVIRFRSICLCFLSFLNPFLLLLPIVCTLKTNRALLELHLSSNQLNGYQDAMQLGDLLRYNSTLQTLELSDNVLGDAGKLQR